MRNVPSGQRCRCTDEEKASARRPSFLSRLLGR
jgi:hypothetical protein